MAIQKEKTLANGMVGNYWRITSESYDRVSRVMTVDIALFKDHDQASMTNVCLGVKKTYRFPMTISESMGNRTSFSYTKVKAMAERMVKPINGVGSNVLFDADLAGGEDV